jgi:hypothetical protein
MKTRNKQIFGNNQTVCKHLLLIQNHYPLQLELTFVVDIVN